VAHITPIRTLGLLLICVFAFTAIGAEASKSGVAAAANGSSCWYTGSCMTVGGYLKSNGTYVQPYFRSQRGTANYSLPKIPSPYGYSSSRSYSYGLPRVTMPRTYSSSYGGF
jgi:hypothetical protein